MSKHGVRAWVMPALMTSLLCVLSPIAIPVGVVPVSLSTLMLFLMLYLLPRRQAVVATGVYLFLGLIGLPVFSGYTGGVGKLIGPTGGYLLGYVPLVAVTGVFMARSEKRMVHVLGMVAGESVLYVFGTVWFCYQAGVTPASALMVCVYPFLPLEAVKIALAVMLGPVLQKRLHQAHLL